MAAKEEKLTVLFYLSVPETGKVLEIPVIEIDKKNKTLVFDNAGKKNKTNILMANVNYNGKWIGQ